MIDAAAPGSLGTASVGTIGGLAIDPRLQAMVQAGRYHGVELDPNEFRRPAGETAPSAAALSLDRLTGAEANGERHHLRIAPEVSAL